MINRLGNLTLLGKRLNISIQNADFETKKDKAYRDSDILMTRELVGESNWDPTAIDRRQCRLSKYAFGIWSFPGEPPPRVPEEPQTSSSVAESPLGDAADPGVETEALDQLPEVPTG
jgi:hypothetical protein